MTPVHAIRLWEALDRYWGRDDALVVGTDSHTAHAFCPLHEFPTRSLDVVIDGTIAGLHPRCGCDRDEILRALGLEQREAAA